MLVPSKVIKTTSKAALKDKMASCVAAASAFLFCVFAVIFAADILSYITQSIIVSLTLSFLLSVFVLLPVFSGVLRYIWLVLSNIVENPVQIFYYFSSKARYFRVVAVSAHLALRAFVWGFVFMLPAIVVSVLIDPKFYEACKIPIPEFIGNLWVLEVFLGLAGFVCWFFMMLRCYLAPFLLVTCEEMNANEIMSMSYRLSKRTMFDFVCLIFSMIVWVLVSLVGIPIIFTLPYFLMTYTVHCCYAVAQYNRTVNEMNSKNYTVGI